MPVPANSLYLRIKRISMNGNITFTMIKPDAFAAGYSGKILDLIIANGFNIKALKLCKLTVAEAQSFYAVHRERPFFAALVDFMSSGPVIAAKLEKDNAVDDFRELIGKTNPEEAAPGTIRELFAQNIQKNAIHGSDSDENALRESAFFFSALEEV